MHTHWMYVNAAQMNSKKTNEAFDDLPFKSTHVILFIKWKSASIYSHDKFCTHSDNAKSERRFAIMFILCSLLSSPLCVCVWYSMVGFFCTWKWNLQLNPYIRIQIAWSFFLSVSNKTNEECLVFKLAAQFQLWYTHMHYLVMEKKASTVFPKSGTQHFYGTHWIFEEFIITLRNDSSQLNNVSTKLAHLFSNACDSRHL